MGVSFFTDFGLTEIAIVLAALGYVVHLVLDALGISRTSKTLRVENEDLVRRNVELEEVVRRMQGRIETLEAELAVLVPQVAELKARDQVAVLSALAEHEVVAAARHEQAIEVLVEIRDAVRASS